MDLRAILALTLVFLLAACSFSAKESIANECGQTAGYKEKTISANSHIITIYTGLYWNDSKVERTLNERARLLCRAEFYNLEKNTNAITYLDGCLIQGNSIGEASWKLTCQN